MRAAIYARVSTFDQEPENQLVEIRRYVAARGWDSIGEWFHWTTGEPQGSRPFAVRAFAVDDDVAAVHNGGTRQ